MLFVLSPPLLLSVLEKKALCCWLRLGYWKGVQEGGCGARGNNKWCTKLDRVADIVGVVDSAQCRNSSSVICICTCTCTLSLDLELLRAPVPGGAVVPAVAAA